MDSKNKFKSWLADRVDMQKNAYVPEPVSPPQPPAAIKTTLEKSEKPIERANDYDYDADQEPYVPVGINGILAATEKLLAVNRGLADTDERDSQAFKKVFTTDKLLSQRIRTDAGQVRKRLLRMAAHRKNLSVLGPLAFDEYTEKQLVNNPLSSPLEEINPMQLIESARRITQMGPGGIASDESITPEMQAVHASSFGFIDNLSGPESSRAGIDTRLTWGTKFGSDGRLYQLFRNRRTGKLEYRSPADLDGKVVKLPE